MAIFVNISGQSCNLNSKKQANSWRFYAENQPTSRSTGLRGTIEPFLAFRIPLCVNAGGG
jgi:hypothetical protein